MFKQNFINLCNKKGVAPTAACRAVGLSNATFTCWTDESVPRRATLQRIADYFGVSVDYLLGKSEDKEPPAYADGELEENMIVFHRDGKTQKKKFTKEQMAMFMAMVDAIPDTSSDDI